MDEKNYRFCGLPGRQYAPTYVSWLNQVEIWFNIITQKTIRRGTFRSVKELIAEIQEHVEWYNSHPKPFDQNATADSLLEKIARFTQRISVREPLVQTEHILTKNVNHASKEFHQHSVICIFLLQEWRTEKIASCRYCCTLSTASLSFINRADL
jgi:hypothetical protein